MNNKYLDNKYIRKRLQLLRSELGKPTITIQAKRIGVSRVTLNNFLLGKDVNQDTLKKIEAFIQRYARD